MHNYVYILINMIQTLQEFICYLERLGVAEQLYTEFGWSKQPEIYGTDIGRNIWELSRLSHTG